MKLHSRLLRYGNEIKRGKVVNLNLIVDFYKWKRGFLDSLFLTIFTNVVLAFGFTCLLSWITPKRITKHDKEDKKNFDWNQPIILIQILVYLVLVGMFE